MPNKRPTIGLALGGGGSKGLAHIGVIKVLEEQNIPIDFIAGSSIGALVGGFYAAKKDIQGMEEIALKSTWQQIASLFFDPSFTQGLVRGEKITRFIEEYVGHKTFADLLTPFVATATDMTTAESVFLTTGDVATAIRTSISIPFLLRPVTTGDQILADGGVAMPVPVKPLKGMGADIIIAVNLHEHYVGIKSTDKFGVRTITAKSFSIMGQYLARDNVAGADVVVTPEVGSFGLFDRFFGEMATKEVISAGEAAMREAMPALQAALRKHGYPKHEEQEMGVVGKFLQLMKKPLDRFRRAYLSSSPETKTK